MLITKAEIEADPSLPKKLKSWAASLNLSIKEGRAPTFKVSGPRKLQVRLRKTGSPKGAYNFMGDEEFTVSTVLVEKRIDLDGFQLLVVMNPADPGLAGEIVSVGMQLDEAIEAFEGLEDWVAVSQLESEERAVAKAKAEPPMVILPTVEETRASASWGAW